MQIATIKLNTDIPKQECDVAAMVHEICSQLQSSIYSKQAVIETTLECETIVYPKAYLENILYNLVSNSLKYNRPGIAPEIKIAVTKRAGKVIISVKDNGLGIDMERYADRVFKPNQVFHKGFDSKGIGLYITKTQIESLGGSILLLSKPNEGCEFIVAL
jgi:signal transduction histidine kinase